MRKSIPGTAFFVWLTLAAGLAPVLAQDPPAADEADGSSQQVEESDEEFRRRMELEDARTRDLGFPTPAASPQTDLEKIDKLPEKSRDNIRDQMIDVIVENGEWEPFDALREYPYEPTAAAQADPGLLQKEQEAWDEQIRKYHEREAAAFGANRGPVPGPGNPGGQEGGAPAGEVAGEQADAERAGGQASPQVSQQAGEGAGEGAGEQGGASGTYQPYESNRSPAEDEVSTAGTQQSALDFLRGQQGQAQPAASGTPSASPSAPPSGSPTATSAAAAQAGAGESASASEPETESAAEAEPEVSLDTRGLIPIEDLDKLEGAEVPAEPDESEQP